MDEFLYEGKTFVTVEGNGFCRGCDINYLSPLCMRLDCESNDGYIIWKEKKEEEPMFRDAKIGDKVWCILKGWGTIVNIFAAGDYPLEVEFESGLASSFTLSGKYTLHHKNPSLYWDELKFDVPPKPKRKVKKEAWLDFALNQFGKPKALTPDLFSTKEKALLSRCPHLYYIKEPVKIEWGVEE